MVANGLASKTMMFHPEYIPKLWFSISQGLLYLIDYTTLAFDHEKDDSLVVIGAHAVAFVILTHTTAMANPSTPFTETFFLIGSPSPMPQIEDPWPTLSHTL